jgi:hypothetical protein
VTARQAGPMRTHTSQRAGSLNWQLPATFRFSSTALSWLVVSGLSFQVGETGAVNGAGTYRVLLTGVDGQQSDGGGDLVRLRVRDPAAGNVVVYDSTVHRAATDNARPIPVLTGNLDVR